MRRCCQTVDDSVPTCRRVGHRSGRRAGVRRSARRLQIFSDNPTAWRRRPEPPEELRRRSASGSPSAASVRSRSTRAYLVNLAGPEPDRLRAVDRGPGPRAARTAPAFDAAFVNVHIGSHRDTSVADGDRPGWPRASPGSWRRPMPAPDVGPMLVLENSAGGGFGLGVDLDELTAIADALAARGIDDAPGRLLPRHGPCLGRGHRPVGARGRRRVPRASSTRASGWIAW